MNTKICTLLIVCLFFQTAPVCSGEARKATIVKIQGTVEVFSQEDWRPAQAGMVLNEKDQIRTGSQSAADLMLDETNETGRLTLESESRLLLNTMQINRESGEKTTLLDLAVGNILVQAEKLKDGSRFEVRTPNSIAGVRGTVFRISATPKNSPSE